MANTNNIASNNTDSTSDKSKNLRVIAAGAAYELNNLLTGISGYMEYMETENEVCALPAEKIRKLIKRAEYTLDKLLNLTKNSGFEKKYFLPEDEIDGALDILNFMLKTENVTIIREYSNSEHILFNIGDFNSIILNMLVEVISSKNISGKREILIKTVSDAYNFYITIWNSSSETINSDINKKVNKVIFSDENSVAETSLKLSQGMLLVRDLVISSEGSLSISLESGKYSEFRIQVPLNSYRKIFKEETSKQILDDLILKETIIEGTAYFAAENYDDYGLEIELLQKIGVDIYKDKELAGSAEVCIIDAKTAYMPESCKKVILLIDDIQQVFFYLNKFEEIKYLVKPLGFNEIILISEAIKNKNLELLPNIKNGG